MVKLNTCISWLSMAPTFGSQQLSSPGESIPVNLDLGFCPTAAPAAEASQYKEPFNAPTRVYAYLFTCNTRQHLVLSTADQASGLREKNAHFPTSIKIHGDDSSFISINDRQVNTSTGFLLRETGTVASDGEEKKGGDHMFARSATDGSGDYVFYVKKGPTLDDLKEEETSAFFFLCQAADAAAKKSVNSTVEYQVYLLPDGASAICSDVVNTTAKSGFLSSLPGSWGPVTYFFIAVGIVVLSVCALYGICYAITKKKEQDRAKEEKQAIPTSPNRRQRQGFQRRMAN